MLKSHFLIMKQKDNVKKLAPLSQILFIIPCIYLTACAYPVSMMKDQESHEDVTYRGIGYTSQRYADNHFSISYKTPTLSGLDSSDNAWVMWNKKANSLCNSDIYFVRNETEGKSTDHHPGWLQVVSGEVICGATSKAEADLVVEKMAEKERIRLLKLAETERAKVSNLVEQEKAKVPTLIDSQCSDFSENGSNYYDTGKKLYEYNLYSEAMNCFLTSINNNEGNNDVFFQIGLMYELGDGVDMDKELAKKWYERANSAIR